MKYVIVCTNEALEHGKDLLHHWATKEEISLITVQNSIIDTKIFSEYTTVPTSSNELHVLKKAIEFVKNDFVILNTSQPFVSHQLESLFEHAEVINKKEQYATLSPSMYNTAYPHISIYNFYGSDFAFVQAEAENDSLYAKDIPTVTTTEISGNPYLCYFNYEQYQQLDGFNFESYLTIKECLFDYFYYVNDAQHSNIVSREYSLIHKWPHNTHLEEVEIEQEKVLRKYTHEYLSYEPVEQMQNSHADEYYASLSFRKAFSGKESNQRILFINPSSVFVNGLNTFVSDIVQTIKDTHFYSLEPTAAMNEAKYFQLIHYFNGIEVERTSLQYFDSMHISNTSSQAYKKLVADIIKIHNITFMHINIMALGHTLDAPKVAKDMGIPSLLSLHDLYYLSGEFTQKDTNIPYNKKVLFEKYNIFHVETFYEKWHADTQQMFNHLDHIVGFSQSTIDIYQKWYDLGGKTQVIPHGYHYERRHSLGAVHQPGEPLRLVFLGRLELEKGSDILWNLAKKYKNVELHIFGVIDDKRFQKKTLPSNIHVYGTYNKRDLPTLLSTVNPHGMILPSLWDETFAFTLTESYLYGIYPIVSNKGALQERVNNAGIGYVFDVNNNKNIDDIVEHLEAYTPEDWEHIYANIQQLHLDTIEEVMNKYQQLYRITSEKNISWENWRSDQEQQTKHLLLSNLDSDYLRKKRGMTELYDSYAVTAREKKSRAFWLTQTLRKLKMKIVGEKLR